MRDREEEREQKKREHKVNQEEVGVRSLRRIRREWTFFLFARIGF